MKQGEQQQKFSPLIEHLIPNATIQEKEIAQVDLDAFMSVMYRIYQRFEKEGRFPLPDDGTLTKSSDMQ